VRQVGIHRILAAPAAPTSPENIFKSVEFCTHSGREAGRRVWSVLQVLPTGSTPAAPQRLSQLLLVRSPLGGAPAMRQRMVGQLILKPHIHTVLTVAEHASCPKICRLPLKMMASSNFGCWDLRSTAQLPMVRKEQWGGSLKRDNFTWLRNS
jgi:hypothetical protein